MTPAPTIEFIVTPRIATRVTFQQSSGGQAVRILPGHVHGGIVLARAREWQKEPSA